MKIKNEEDVLSEEFRSMVIEEIGGEENQQRKMLEKKRYDIFKDGTRKYVLERLAKEYSEPETLRDAEHRTANLSVLRKIIDKKSVVYKDGVIREVNSDNKEEEKQIQLDDMTELLNITSKMKKVNRYLENHKNCEVYIAPYADPLTGKMKIKTQVLPPYLYDVIEDAENPEVPRVYIFSYMGNAKSKNNNLPNESGQRKGIQTGNNFRQGDGVDQVIADSPNDAGKEEVNYIWWTNKYHFTTNEKGEIVSGGDDILNPIGRMPFVNFAKDRDGQYFAIGGDDLIEGAVLVNHLLTDLYFIAKYQGQGIFYITGKGLPKSIKVGPNDALVLEVGEGDPNPQIGFATSNPPIESHMKMIEQYIALLLSTNNLEPGTISGDLSASNASSGIHAMIQQSELNDDIEDQRELYRDQEPLIYDVIFRWNNLLIERGVAHSDFEEIGMVDLEDFKYKLVFPAPKRFMTDKEKLEIIEKRKELGLDTMLDTIMRDNPDLTNEESEQKLIEITAGKLHKSRQHMIQIAKPIEKEEDDGQGDESN